MSTKFEQEAYEENHPISTFLKKAKLPAIIVGILLLVLICRPIQTVVEGRVGIHYRLGKLLEFPVQPGIHLSIPFIDYWDILDVREKAVEMKTMAYTKDTQTVEGFDMIINYTYDINQLEKIVKDIGVNYVETKIVQPNALSTVKNHIGKYKAEELVQNRSKLESEIFEDLHKEFSKNGLKLSAVNIKDIDFEDSFEATIREKVAAEQEALKVKNQTLKIQEEANQIKIKAEAEGEAKKIKADADAYEMQKVQEQLAKSPQYVELQKVQKWDGKYPQIMGNTVNPWLTIGNNQ